MPAVNRKRDYLLGNPLGTPCPEPELIYEPFDARHPSDDLTARGLQIRLARRVAGAALIEETPGKAVSRMLGTIGMLALAAWVIAAAAVTAVSAIFAAIA